MRGRPRAPSHDLEGSSRTLTGDSLMEQREQRRRSRRSRRRLYVSACCLVALPLLYFVAIRVALAPPPAAAPPRPPAQRRETFAQAAAREMAARRAAPDRRTAAAPEREPRSFDLKPKEVLKPKRFVAPDLGDRDDGDDDGREAGADDAREPGAADDVAAEPPAAAPPVSATLATQASADRAWLLRFICARWPAAVSVAVHDDGAGDAANAVRAVADEAVCGAPGPLSATPDGAAAGAVAAAPGQLVFRARAVLGGRADLRLFASRKRRDPFPINALRNAALLATKTTHVLTVDVDFFPSAELHGAIVAQADLLASSPRLALVVPAFSRKGQFKNFGDDEWRRRLSAPGFVPATFAELVGCVAAVDCVVFDFTWNRDAHATTDSGTWLAESAHAALGAAGDGAKTLRAAASAPPGKDAPKPSAPYAAPAPRAVACFKSSRYEPYVVVRNDPALMPAYDANFTGYGKNKIEHVRHLRHDGFAFAVLPLGFLVHAPHPWSKSKRGWMKKGRGKHATDKLFKEADSKYDEASLRDGATPLCPGAKT